MGRTEFGDRIRRLLEGKDLDELARALNLKDTSAFSHYGKGERTPNYDRLAILCRKLNVTADYLLGLSDEMRPISVTPMEMTEREEYIEIRLRCPHCKKVIEKRR